MKLFQRIGISVLLAIQVLFVFAVVVSVIALWNQGASDRISKRIDGITFKGQSHGDFDTLLNLRYYHFARNCTIQGHITIPSEEREKGYIELGKNPVLNIGLMDKDGFLLEVIELNLIDAAAIWDRLNSEQKNFMQDSSKLGTFALKLNHTVHGVSPSALSIASSITIIGLRDISYKLFKNSETNAQVDILYQDEKTSGDSWVAPFKDRIAYENSLAKLVEVGMNTEEVINLCGEPRTKGYESNSYYWRYGDYIIRWKDSLVDIVVRDSLTPPPPPPESPIKTGWSREKVILECGKPDSIGHMGIFEFSRYGDHLVLFNESGVVQNVLYQPID